MQSTYKGKKKRGGERRWYIIFHLIGNHKWILTAIHVVCINRHVFQESKVWHLILLLLNQLYPYVRTCNFATHHLFCYVFWPRLDFFLLFWHEITGTLLLYLHFVMKFTSSTTCEYLWNFCIICSKNLHSKIKNEFNYKQVVWYYVPLGNIFQPYHMIWYNIIQ